MMMNNRAASTAPVIFGDIAHGADGIGCCPSAASNPYRAVRWPAPELEVVNCAPRRIADKLRVVVFNARGGARVSALLECLRRPPLADADLILLCDVDCLNKRSGYREVASEIASMLRMSFAYVPKYKKRASSVNPVSLGGNAILSSQPLADVAVVALPSIEHPGAQVTSKRYGIVASAVFNRHRIMLGVVHLTVHSSPAERKSQIDAFVAALPPKVPALIGGDFNTTTVDLSNRWAFAATAVKMMLNSRRFRSPQEHEPLFESLQAAGFHLDNVNEPFRATFTYSSIIPSSLRPKLDWIAVRGLSPVYGSAAVVPARLGAFDRRISDHDFVVCELHL